ncbi:exonuclease domain-containing protein [Persicitalea sp.]|uniref:3'-5' exonuclease n=1 Tax=Persicitalea sp. TaxID=3100273 RepID=UPI003593350A
MTYLIIDTETNGLPQSYHLPVTDLTNWPRLISVAWGLYDEAGNQLSHNKAMVKPVGYRWNPAAQRVHGITPERVEGEGRPLVEVLNQLEPDIERADAWVGHHVVLDHGVIGAEFLRMGKALNRPSEFPTRPQLCTMEASTQVTANGEPVKLDELYRLLMGKTMKGMHDATADMLATAACFFELKKRGIF